MIKKSILLLLFFCSLSFSQSITVDNSTRSPAQLVNLLVGNSCLSVSNITISSANSVGYFNKNSSTFPINEGIILRSGSILSTQGTYTNTNLSSTATGGGSDVFLQNLSTASSGTATQLTDVSFLEFDFVPVSSSFSFDFLFASNEYGQFQCLSNDIFAFKLTNISTGVTTNLGVVPSSNSPVSVKTIKNKNFNATCDSTNPSLFSVYNVTNPTNSALNMRGHTVMLNASSAVTPNTAYRLKLVIADYGDTDFDSAVFISGGSFTNTLNLGADQTICTGNTITLDTQLGSSYNYRWLRNGTLVGGNTATYDVTSAGTYTVEIRKGSCFLTDTIVFKDLSVINPINLQTCNTGAANYDFDLTANDEAKLGINNATYNIVYYSSIANANSNTPVPAPATRYNTSSNQTVYLKIFNTITNQFCDAIYSFNLQITAAVVATQPADVPICATAQPYVLSSLNSQVVNGQSGYTVLYYNSQPEAIAGGGAPISSITIPSGTASATVWIRMQSINNPSCFDVTRVQFIVNPLPPVDTIAPVIECSTYVLPTLVNGNYFSGPNGTGTALFAGNTINNGSIYYVRSGPDANGCTNETSFNVTFIDEYTLTLDNCGSFILPVPPNNIGAFYTAANGPNGTGTMIPSGTIFTNTTQTTQVQTVYYYAIVNNVLCTDKQFNIQIHPLPLADNPADVTYCNSYTLPALTNGRYYSSAGGTGVQLNATDIITTSQIIYVYNANTYLDVNNNTASCTVDNPFNVNIIDTTLYNTISRCVTYTLPTITIGGYFSQPMGGGVAIDPSVPITTSQMVYYYATTSVAPNCTDNLKYTININPQPTVDVIPSASYCGEYILPTLTNGRYYTLAGGPGIVGQTQLNAGQIIDLTGNNLAPGTYYVFSGPDTNTCTNESSFTIAIRPVPIVDDYINQVLCSPYSIPAPTLGQIYTMPNGPSGTGVLVAPTDVFNTDRRFYVYYRDPVSGCAADKPFELFYNGINLPNYQNVSVCDTYTLPTLTHVPPEPSTNYTIGYYYNNNGTNPVPNGTVFTASNTPVSVFVYAVNNGRFGVNCIEVDEILITVSQTPKLALQNLTFANEKCGTYVLPALPTVPYTINYYSQSGGNAANLITNLTLSTAGTYTYYVYASAPNNANCNDEQAFTFTIYPLLDLTVQGGIICVDPITNINRSSFTLQTGLNPALFTVNWYLNGTLMGTGSSYEATTAGTYTVEFTKLTPDSGANCNYKNTTVEITQSSTAIASVLLSDYFEDSTLASVIDLNGYGTYIYQVDQTPYQNSSIFSNLMSGDHIMYIKDTKNNCGVTKIPFKIVNYPKFFTPNGDTYNDTWNIFDLSFQPNSKISIFDRFGKLIKQIATGAAGWDGTYNGKELPATDYWFVLDYEIKGEAKQLKGHFAMKR